METRRDSLFDYIKIYDNALEPELCETMLREFEDDWAHQVSTGLDKPKVTADGQELWKKFTEIDFSTTPSWQTKYGKHMKDNLMSYAHKYFEDVEYPSHLMPNTVGYEGFRLKRFLPGDRIDEHTDATNIGVCKRFLTFMWYLNDVEDGGHTRFTLLNHYVKPEVGKLLVFPPLWLFPHAGLPINSGAKYIMQSYLHYTTSSNDFNVVTDLHPLKSGAVKKDK